MEETFEELVAWLNPRTIRYDVGRGGIPSITPQDVAAALGIARGQEPLGVEIILQRSAPDLAALSARDRRGMVADLAIREHCRRQRALIRAGEAKTTAELRMEFRMATRLDLQDATQRHEQARAEAWPRLGPTWAKLIELIDCEQAAHGRCKACGGTGEIWIPTAVGLSARATCRKCGGSGVEQTSGRRRAEQIGVTEGAWRTTWTRPHDWLSAECERSRLAARRVAARALFESAETA